MGTSGPGLWDDDTAADIRSIYREALQDGASDEAARHKILSDFAVDLNDSESTPVVWLALAAVQQSLGRLENDVRDAAVQAIDSGADLRRWEGSSPRLIAQRRQTLEKLRTKFLAPPLPRKAVRKARPKVSTLVPGDVLGFRAPSGRVYLLLVRQLQRSRYGAFPLVRLLEYEGTEIPPPAEIARLREREKRRAGLPGQTAEPWRCVGGTVQHRRGHDYSDCGFEVVAHLEPTPPDPTMVLGYSGWEFWQKYLKKQDELLAAAG